MNELISKISRSTSTILELRSKIYAPVNTFSSEEKKNFAAKGKKRIITTQDGLVIVKGTMLTQTHRDILDCLFSEAVDVKPSKHGGLSMVVPTNGLLRSYKKKGIDDIDLAWIKNKIDEIQVSAFEFKTKDKKLLYSFNIINTFAYKEDLELYSIELSPDYCRFFEGQLSVGYKHEVKELLKLDSPLAKAIVRYFWSYLEPVSMTIGEIFDAVGYYSGATKKSRIMRKYIFLSTVSSMENCGIFYDASTETLTYMADNHFSDISFVPPIKDHQPSRVKSRAKAIKIIEAQPTPNEVTPTTREERDAIRQLNIPKDF